MGIGFWVQSWTQTPKPHGIVRHPTTLIDTTDAASERRRNNLKGLRSITCRNLAVNFINVPYSLDSGELNLQGVGLQQIISNDPPAQCAAEEVQHPRHSAPCTGEPFHVNYDLICFFFGHKIQNTLVTVKQLCSRFQCPDWFRGEEGSVEQVQKPRNPTPYHPSDTRSRAQEMPCE